MQKVAVYNPYGPLVPKNKEGAFGMRRWIFLGSAMACVFSSLILARVCAAGDETPSSTSPSWNDLPAQCRKAKVDFRPLTQTDVDQAKNVLLEAVERLERRLDLAGENGEDWRQFLQLAPLREQLQSDRKPDLKVLDRVRSRLNSGYDGLELVWFLDVESAIQNFMATANAVGNAGVKKQYEKIMDLLANGLEAYQSQPTTEGAASLGESLRWLSAARQAPELVRAVQDRYVRPNLLAEISEEVLGAGIAEKVDDITPVRDCILGTDIHGTAHTVGQIHLELSPHGQFGVLDAIFLGHATSENVGFNGPVTIFSTGSTGLAARKRIWIDAEGIASHPATSNARTSVAIHDIRSHNGRRMIERMAWKRAMKQLSLAQAIASRHAEERLNRRIDAQAAESLEKANRGYIDKFQRPFTERKLFPQDLRFSTDARRLLVTALQAGGGKLAAPGDPPPVPAEADMTLRIHESMINNLAFDALAGRTVYEEKLQSSVVEALGRLPEKMKGDEDGKPWAITFAPRRPIFVSFGDGGFKITLQGVKYYKGNEAHPGMIVSASYKIEKTPNGFKAVRQGDIRVDPYGLEPGQQVDARRQVVRTLLEKRFAKIFQAEMLGEGLVLPGKWEAAGKLQPIQVTAENGWLTIAWKRPAAGP